MAFCVQPFSWISCGGVNLFNFFISPFLHLEGLPLYLVSLFVSSLFLYILAKILGKAGSILLIVIGLLGAFFTAGISLILTILGLILLFLSRAAILIVLINIFLFALCIACYVV